MSSKKGMGLGRGLNALIGNDEDFDVEINENDRVVEIDINRIEPNRKQPRTYFDEESLRELSQSIESIGILNPLIVKKNGDTYEIIAGERRWRAARLAKLKTAPVIIREYSDFERLEVSLIENVQREDLNPIEEALTYKRFHDEFNLNQEAIAEKVGKSRSAITNCMRLLKLDERVQAFIKENKLSAGHARALLAIENNDMQFDIAEKIIENNLSVRETEELVKRIMAKNENENNDKQKTLEKNEVYSGISDNLQQIFGTKVSIKPGKNKSKIEIEFYSDEELDRLLCLFKKL